MIEDVRRNGSILLPSSANFVIDLTDTGKETLVCARARHSERLEVNV